jgi:peptide/nickel transport system substrate-binding protein
MWKKINVGVNLEFLYGRTLFATCQSGGPLSCRTYDAAIYTWLGGDDPAFWGLYNCAAIPSADNNWSGQNIPGWCNKDADTALATSEGIADIAVSRDKRKPYIDQFFRAFAADVPAIPLYVTSVPVVYRAGLNNYACGPTPASDCGWNVQQWELSR